MKQKTKKLLFFLGSVFLLLGSFSSPSGAQEQEVTVHIFSSNACPHCRGAKDFLTELEKKYEEVAVIEYEITTNAENAKLLKKTKEMLGEREGGIPFMVIGEETLLGFYNAETTGKEIENIAVKYLNGEREYVDSVESIKNSKGGVFLRGENIDDKSGTVNVPIIGKVDVKNASLPFLTLVIAGLDGFNPCAMWVLVFLISLLLGMKDRKRMWILGSAFIVASAAVYFLFMAAWLNLLLFLGFIVWIRIIVGAVALLSGGYHLKEYFTNKEGVCKVTGGDKRRRIFEKLKEIVIKQKFYLALGGIIILAFAVNLVELVCSAGLPAVYAQILTMNGLSFWQYYAYLLLYIVIFMLDDLIVFVVAMVTLNSLGVTGKYSRYSNLIGGVIMAIIGIMLIFRPEWLAFG